MKKINMLLHNSLVFLLVLLLQLQSLVLASKQPWQSLHMMAKPGCRDKCGNLTIPYPFGIGRGCYFDKAFEIICNDTNHPSSSLAFSPWINTPIYYISMDSIRTDMPLIPVLYDKSTGKNVEGDEPLQGAFIADGYFSISSTENKLIAIGCDIFAYLEDTESGEIVSGCASFCNRTANNFASSTSSCTGKNGCCQSVISRLPTSIRMSTQTMNTRKAAWAYNNCSYFSIAQSGYSKYIPEILNANSSNCDEDEDHIYLAELAVDWVISNMSCEQAIKSAKYVCGNNTDCVHVNSASSNIDPVGYRCRCSHGYEGNAYLSDGCQDINECTSPNANWCPHNTRCVNAPGSFYCEPNKERHVYALQLSLGIAGAVILIALVASYILLRRQIKRMKEKKAKHKFFQRNGGLLLQQRISFNEGSHSTLLEMKLFQKEELEKATDNFNESRILGEGGLGTVYKGMLSDGSIVAIKRSNVVDEDQVGQFVNEIFILSQINHRHIVKVLGCCLETQVPLLVYEYISNGTLSHHIHENSSMPMIRLSWEHRLRIAKEVAGALAYLHSHASTAIFHRDIKSSNILLDENYRAVVSDFGLSRLVPIEKTHLTTQVGGTFGYIDPEYFGSGQLNDKSDVYAFGVVLAELLTSQRAVSIHDSDSQSLVISFKSKFKQDRILEIVDPEIAREEDEETVLFTAKLVKRCLKFNARNRPNMEEVAAELDELRRKRNDLIHFESSKNNIAPDNKSLNSHRSERAMEDNQHSS